MLYLLLFGVLLYTIYLYGIRTHSYWKKKGIKHDRTLPYFGNNLKQFTQRASVAMMATEVYKKYPKEKVVGFYRGTRPQLVIRDTEIIKRVLVTDFNHFYAKAINTHKTFIEPLMKNLFTADGDLWRLLRQRFTPTFSSAKLKAMFHIITDKAEKLQSLAEQVASKDAYDVRELLARYMTELIGASGFGINMDCLSNETSQFRKLGKRIVLRTPRDALAFTLKTLFPELFKRMHLFADEIEESMIYLVQNVMKERNYKPNGRNDFIDLLLEIRQKHGKMVGESIEEYNPAGTPKVIERELDDLLLTAQVFIFFAAGFETSSSTSSYTLHQLAFNPECQKKAQKEIDRVLAKYNNKMTYEAIQEMTYVEMAFHEAMRMYPTVGYFERKCTSKEYTIPEIGLTINDEVKVIIPVQALHNDEKYFPNSELFDPERFHPDKKEFPKFVYMPFGEGPRACVAARLGKMQSLAAIVAILQKFTVEPAACSLKNPIPDPAAFIVEGFIGGLPLKLRKREICA